MTWRLEFRPEVAEDVVDAAAWYEDHELSLGAGFIDEIENVWAVIADFPLIGRLRHPSLNIRWRYPERFPYRVIYSVDESTQTVLVIAVLHAARHDRHWTQRTV